MNRPGLGACCLLIAVAAGCGNTRSADPPHPPAQPTRPAVEAAPAAPPPSPPGGETWDAEGVTVERAADGTLHVSGTDRWGVRIDTVFADATYFANAVPVLARSLSEPQAQALTALVPRVRAAASPPGSAP